METLQKIATALEMRT
ncbi:MAG: hypothetical protein ACLU9V_00640 [Roseburia sp.]